MDNTDMNIKEAFLVATVATDGHIRNSCVYVDETSAVTAAEQAETKRPDDIVVVAKISHVRKNVIEAV